MKACVIGSPVSHSLSPAIFAYISYHERQKIFYEAREVKTPELLPFLEGVRRDQEFYGMNVTIPLKEEVMVKVDSLSSAARTIGAVNVVHVNGGKLDGHNTDVIGIEKTFKEAHFVVKDSICLLWGAGGSAKAVAFVLGELKAKKVYVYNRGSRGSDLARQYDSLYPETHFTAITSLKEIQNDILDLMINTTPLGMQGQESGISYFQEAKNLSFSKRALAFDLIYVPEETDFLKTAQNLGLSTIGGLGMLIDQAIATWEIWVGQVQDSETLHQKLKAFLRGMLRLRHDERPILFTGFMGAGKTTCGHKLSQLSKKEFIDTDELISKHSGKSIPEIFEESGEVTFRSLESQAIQECLTKKKNVVSLGGGALKAASNREVIKRNGILVYLKASPETLKSRLDQDETERPLLMGLSESEKMTKISQLLSEREALYQEADITIETTNKSPEEICFELVSRLGEKSVKKKIIKLNIEKKTYPIIIGDKVLSAIRDYLPEKVSKIIVLSDKRLTQQRNALLKELKTLKIPVVEIPVTAGEGLKDIDSVYPIYGKMLDAKADRDALLIALGGGTIGDVGGFIASTYLRGIPWIGIPTTLLAQVDSSVGGKTGINHSSGKNLIGSFYQPSLVVCDLSFLKTLGKREMISGIGEIVKYSFTFDKKYFKWLEKNLNKIIDRNASVLTDAITTSLTWKCDAVSQDVQDRIGVREVLNFGHTFGHALEAATQYKKFQHGEAVIWGMRFALQLSVIRGKLSEKKWMKMDELLNRLEVPAIPKNLKRDDILKHMKRDKKAEGDKVRFVLLDDIGHSVSDKEVTKENLDLAFLKLTGRKM